MSVTSACVECIYTKCRGVLCKTLLNLDFFSLEFLYSGKQPFPSSLNFSHAWCPMTLSIPTLNLRTFSIRPIHQNNKFIVTLIINNTNHKTLSLCRGSNRVESHFAAFFKTGILACALKKDMVKHNIMKVKDNHQPITPITA
jgi:hypothetical protein